MRTQFILYAIALHFFVMLSPLHAQITKRLPELTMSEMLADYNRLCTALTEAHGGIYRFSSKATINKKFDLYRGKLKHIKTRQEFTSLLSEMLAELRDGHMRLEYDEMTMANLAKARLFPLRISIEGTRLIVMYNDSRADSSLRPGMEILTINGRKCSDLIRTILPNLSGDGYIESGKVRRLERTFAQQYWLFISRVDSFTITAKDVKRKTITSKLAGILAAEREANRNANPVNDMVRTTVTRLDGKKENLSLQFINGNDIACLRIRSFDDQQLPGPVKSAFHSLLDKKTKVLILDLRGNVGGIDEHGALLVSYLINKPFRYFDRIHLSSIRPSFNTWKPVTAENLQKGTIPDPKGGYLVTSTLHTGVAVQQPAAFSFPGKLFVLMDGGTFSTAADVTALLRHLTPAVFIGEESGGTMEGNTSGLNAVIKLPSSKMSVKIHMYEYWNAVSLLNKGRGVLPDHPVAKRMTDLLQGVDLAMNRAVDLAQESLNGTEK